MESCKTQIPFVILCFVLPGIICIAEYSCINVIHDNNMFCNASRNFNLIICAFIGFTSYCLVAVKRKIGIIPIDFIVFFIIAGISVGLSLRTSKTYISQLNINRCQFDLSLIGVFYLLITWAYNHIHTQKRKKRTTSGPVLDSY
jgi:hypothetical protein